jgi:hypothetical protein
LVLPKHASLTAHEIQHAVTKTRINPDAIILKPRSVFVIAAAGDGILVSARHDGKKKTARDRGGTG